MGYVPPPDVDMIDVNDLEDRPVTDEDVRDQMELNKELMKIDRIISLTQMKKGVLSADADFLEVSERVLKHFSHGQIPESNYMIYKNVRLCLKGKVQEIIQKDNRTTFEVNHPDLAKTTKMVQT